jgi:nucleoside-diphosphate-sugar epimerase
MKVMLSGANGFVCHYVAGELERQDIEYLILQRGMASDDRAIQLILTD